MSTAMAPGQYTPASVVAGASGQYYVGIAAKLEASAASAWQQYQSKPSRSPRLLAAMADDDDEPVAATALSQNLLLVLSQKELVFFTGAATAKISRSLYPLLRRWVVPRLGRARAGWIRALCRSAAATRQSGDKQLTKQAFDRAQSIDPSLALPWAGMSMENYHQYGSSPVNESFESCLKGCADPTSARVPDWSWNNCCPFY